MSVPLQDFRTISKIFFCHICSSISGLLILAFFCRNIIFLLLKSLWYDPDFPNLGFCTHLYQPFLFLAKFFHLFYLTMHLIVGLRILSFSLILPCSSVCYCLFCKSLTSEFLEPFNSKGESCTNYRTCLACMTDVSCGWCVDSCIERTDLQSSQCQVELSHPALVLNATHCSVCADFVDCETCLAVSLLLWDRILCI